MLDIKMPIVVEGKYDRLRVLGVANATVIATDGFGIFKKEETAKLIKRLAKESGIIVLTDSDGAGTVIRNRIKGIAESANVINVYIPQIKGKEKRKRTPSKEGFLGVEGMERDVIEKVLLPYSGERPTKKAALTKADLYELGLSGRPDSAKRREAVAARLDLPKTLSPSALLEAINLTASKEEFLAAVNESEE